MSGVQAYTCKADSSVLRKRDREALFKLDHTAVAKEFQNRLSLVTRFIEAITTKRADAPPKNCSLRSLTPQK